MIDLKSLKQRIFKLFRRNHETHVVVCDDEEDEFPKSYVVNNRRELECLKRTLLDDDVKNIRHHRIFTGILKWLFYIMLFYLFSDIILDWLYRLHLLVHGHNPWDIPKLFDEYFFHDKRGFPNPPLK